MSEQKISQQGEWSSRFAFVLAATGSAVGLGNIWKFPYVTGENGGGRVCAGLFAVCAVNRRSINDGRNHVRQAK